MIGSKPFDYRIVFLKEFFEKVDFEKGQQTAKIGYLPSGSDSGIMIVVLVLLVHPTSVHTVREALYSVYGSIPYNTNKN